MIKRDEATHPNSCWNKAKDDEMLFVLLARDIAGADTVRFWVKQRISMGKNKADDPQIIEALHCADKMQLEFEARSTY